MNNTAKQTSSVIPNVSFRDEHPDLGDGRTEILAGLMAARKIVDPKWFYDQQGSELFDQITRLPEYYPTRTEVQILTEHVDSIAARCGLGCLLIEPGSGSSEKARLLLDSLRPTAYVPVDISANYLKSAAERLGEEYPWLQIDAVCADFNHDWHYLDDLPRGKRVVFYPGSTIGNMEPEEAQRFLERLADIVGPHGGILIGIDTHKSTEQLHAAYNDAQGLTAAFNLNLLARINLLTEADFHLDGFSHRAFYNEQARRIEMHLVSNSDQQVTVAGTPICFSAGETIHTENSYKYSPEDVSRLVGMAGLDVVDCWSDPEELFAVYYLHTRR